jgi:ABC-type multidrug transport system ATPase subunit
VLTLNRTTPIVPQTGEIALEVDGLVKSYGKVVAVRGISFHVPRGQVVGLLGPNGAGKSTTIKVCLGRTRPTRGTVRVFGSTPAAVEARRHMGYSPETPYFYPFLTAEEILAFYAGLQGIKSVPAGVDRVLRATGLEAARRRKVGHFSKGMIQRLAVAQSLLGDPELLFLDEPSSGLDPEGRLEMRQIIQELKRSGRTILLSSHILGDIDAVCDRVIVLWARARHSRLRLLVGVCLLQDRSQ